MRATRESGVSCTRLLDAARDGFLAIDADGVIRYGNARAEQIFGYAHDQLVGRPVALFLPEVAAVARARRDELRCRGRRRDGSELSVEVRLSHMRTDGKAMTLAVVREVGEQDYRHLLETSLEGVWVIDDKGRTTFANSRMAEMLGGSVEGMIGRSFLDFVPEEEREGARAKLEQRRNGAHEVHEFSFRRADGSVLRTSLATSPLFDDHGTFLGALAMVRDITTAKQAEERLAESQNLIRAVIDGATDAVYVKDREGRYVFINTAAASVDGRLPEEVVGKDDTSLFALETARRLQENDAEVMRSGRTATLEEVTVATNGLRKIFSSSKAPWRDAAGRVIGIIGISRDVTERTRIEDEQRLLADVSDALARSIDFESTLQSVANLVVPRLADWCFLDVIDDGRFRATTIAHDDKAQLAVVRQIMDRQVAAAAEPKGQARSRVFRTGKAEMGEVTEQLLASTFENPEPRARLREMGLRFYMIVPLLVRGQTVGVLSLVSAKSGRRFVAQDLAVAAEIGRRAAMAIENSQLYRDAQRAIVARNDLLAMVSHDLRNPLEVLLLRANLLLRQWPGEQSGRAHVEAIQRVVRQMSALTGELLDAASLEAGHVVLECAQCEPKALVDEVAEQFAPMAERKEIRLMAVIEPGLPGLWCDRARLGRVLVNLMDNAIKFTPAEGTITVRAEKHGRELRFSVTDTGAGIPDDQVQHIFDRYSQPAGGARGGAGLGLYIAKGIVEAHRGTIAAESRVGSGTTFHFTIPVVPLR